MTELPTGTLTMLFTDIEGSTAHVHRLGEGYGAVRDQHRRLLRRAVANMAGFEVDCRADEFFAVFQQARDGVTAAVAAQQMLAAHAWPDDTSLRVRMGLHTGKPGVEGGGYLGLDVHRAVRICAAGHGEQILLSQTTRDLIANRFEVRDLGSCSLAGLPAPERIFQLAAAGLKSQFPPLRAEKIERRRSAGRMPRRRTRRPTLAEAAWHVRKLLPDVDRPLQQPLAGLGGALFIADRALTGADGFLERIDNKRLRRRLTAQRKMAVTMRVAHEEAGRLQIRIACVEQLQDRRHALASLTEGLLAKLDALHTEREITWLHEHITTTTDQLDQALTRAAHALDPLSFKLAHTRWRGIYHSGRKYVVCYFDEVGSERQREFETSTEARRFLLSVQTAEGRPRGPIPNWITMDAGARNPGWRKKEYRRRH
jgi:class 3 adenylate cyclase